MSKTYIIKHEPVIPGQYNEDGVFIPSGTIKDKYNIYYYTNGVQEGHPEFYGYNPYIPAEGISIKEGYEKDEESF